MNKNKILPFESEFFIGCNYWASHAGTAMWSNWQESIVDEDLQQLAQEGIEVIRVFPSGPTFSQSICSMVWRVKKGVTDLVKSDS